MYSKYNFYKILHILHIICVLKPLNNSDRHYAEKILFLYRKNIAMRDQMKDYYQLKKMLSDEAKPLIHCGEVTQLSYLLKSLITTIHLEVF